MANHNPFLIVVLGDFNVKSENWYKHNKTSYERVKIDTLTSQFGLQQIIKEPTHILAESSTCIDLIFTSLQNLVMKSGVHSSLHPNCHHQITYATFNLKIHYPLRILFLITFLMKQLHLMIEILRGLTKM